jgi:cell division protein FtsB
MAKVGQRINDLLRRKTLLVANLAFLALAGWGFGGEFMRNRDMQQDIDRLQAQADSLESKNFEIARIGRGLTSSDALEREARLKLGLQRPGESVIIIKDTQPPPPAKLADNATPDAQPRVSNALKWWRYFFQNRF